jgi:hypothetical protein
MQFGMSVIELDSDLAAEIECGEINRDAGPVRAAQFRERMVSRDHFSILCVRAA